MKTSRIVLMLMFVLMLVAVPVLADAPTDGRTGRAELRFLEGMIDHHQMALDMANDCLARTDISDALRAECQAVVDAQQPEIDQMQAWLLAWYNVEYAPMAMSDMSGMMGMMGMMQMMHAGMHDMGGMDHGGMMDMSGMMGMMEMMQKMHAGMHDMGGMGGMDMGGMGGMDMGGMGGMDHGSTDQSGTDHSGMDHGDMAAPATDPAMMMGMMAGFNRLAGVDYEVAWLESMIDHHDDAIHMSERLLGRDGGSTLHAELAELAQNIIDAQTAEIARYEEMIALLNAE